jgi:DNA primase
MDGDDAGQDGMEQILALLLEATTFEIQLVRLPSKFDPDNFLNESSLEDFHKLHRYTPFEWSLEKKTQKMDVDLFEVCNEMIPTIRQEKNIIKRNRLIKTLSEHTSVSEKDIKKELTRLDNEVDFMKKEKLSEIRSDAVVRLNRGEDMKYVFLDCDRKMQDIERMYNADSDEEDEYLSALETIKMRCDTQEKLPGLKCGRFSILEKALDGFASNQCLISLAGKSNIGKTSFMRALSWELARYNDNIFVIYMSIDDSRELMVPPLIAYDQSMDIAKVKNPKHRITEDEEWDKYNQGWDNMMKRS